MIDELCFTAKDMKQLYDALMPFDQERCAVAYATESHRSDGQIRLLVHDIDYPEQADYSSQGIDNAELSPAFVARVTKKARLAQWTLVFIHTHPGKEPPMFSLVDSAGERILHKFLTGRGFETHHAALVISAGGLRARRLDGGDEIRVVGIGEKRVVAFDPELRDADYSPIFDRQVRAFGEAGQQRIGRLKVAVIGVGGTGSIMVQQLVHLGIRHFLLVDPDLVEQTNLNRVVGATSSDIGQAKVSVATRYLRAFDEHSSIEVLLATARAILRRDASSTRI